MDNNENNKIEKPYEYVQKDTNNDREDINNDNSQINYIKDKYTIEDSVNINNILPNSNTNIINNNKANSNNNLSGNFDEIEKQRRKNDLLQMINFSTNLKINNNNNNNNNYINNQNQQSNQINYNEYENYNIVQSYEES